MTQPVPLTSEEVECRFCGNRHGVRYYCDATEHALAAAETELAGWMQNAREWSKKNGELYAELAGLRAEKERLEDHRDALIEANEWWEAKCQRIEAEKERLERENEELKSALNQHGHFLVLGGAGWSIEHPLECRKIVPDGMSGCAVHKVVAETSEEYAWWPVGRYPVELDNTGRIVVAAREADQ